MSTLGRPNPAYAGDRGDPDPELRELLGASGNREGYLRAVAALCTARFLLPVVALGDDGGIGPDPERQAELRAVMLTTGQGRSALVAFTGLDALVAWRPDARPVPCRLDELATAAVDQGCGTVLVDLAGPSPLVVEGDLLAELARGRRLVELPDGDWGWMFVEGAAPREGRDGDSSPEQFAG